MDAELFGWLAEHLADNGVPPDRARLVHAAVSDRTGAGSFAVELDPHRRFGQRFRPGERRGSGVTQDVACCRLEAIVGEETVDFLHSDIQGAEAAVFDDSIELLRERVRSVAVATHARAIHRSVLAALGRAGFAVDHSFRGRGWRATPYGKAYFLDGLIVARNPALPSAS